MNRTIRFTAAALLFGTATIAAAQQSSRAQTFAEQLKQMEALSSTSTYPFKPQPTLRNQADDPVARESFTDRFAGMQAESSSSSEFEPAPALTAQAADPVAKEPFTDRFATMQAESSNSGEFKLPAGGDQTAYAGAGTASVPTATAQPTLTQRMARLLRRDNAAPSQSN
jgi:hypothetical protein